MPDDMSADIRGIQNIAGPVSRRKFVVTSAFAAGFALAVRPALGQSVITTDTAGLTVGDVKIPVAGGSANGYFAHPATGGPFATVLVIHEIFSVHEHIKDIVRRLAKAGYYAIAPDLYSRVGDVGSLKTIDEIRPLVAKVYDKDAMADLDLTVAFAKVGGKADTAKLGVTGFCAGGRYTWLYAEHNPNLKAAVAWYGPLVGQPNEQRPANPIDNVAQLKCPVLGLYGGADQGIPNDTVEQMKAAVQKAGKTAAFVVYPDTPHAFNADYRPSYREAPAKDGWQKMLDWFKKYGVA